MIGALILTVIASIFNCSPNPPEPPPPGFDWRLSTDIIWIPQENWARAHPCPTAGSNCYRRPPSYGTYNATRSAFTNFKSYYDLNDIDGFFADSSNWEDILTYIPNFNVNSDTVDWIRDGTWLTHIAQDSTIIFYNYQSGSDLPVYRLAVVLHLNEPQDD